ncbi:hypothetical protein AX17_006945 [Amanita inopinata Kibby_2008]|nr:hypothetical protein AX17_006945 [Amanita inopinata Kibby_2008]
MDATQTANKKAEFARLFDLFERLTNRGSRKSHAPVQITRATVENTRSLAVPADLAPVIRNLATIVTTRKTKQEQNAKETAITGRPRSNTVTVTGLTMEEKETTFDDGREAVDKFPVGKRYPFTFKMMLHKLYELEEWARKVKEVVEKSQEEYKSLSEVDWEKKRLSVDESRLGRAQTKPRQAGRMRSNSVPGGGLARTRTRCDSSATKEASTADRARRNSRFPLVQTVHESSTGNDDEKPLRDEGSRIVKKRCVGRRKSTDRPLGTESSPVGSTWVYNAAVVSTEVGDVVRQAGSTGSHAKKTSLVTFQLAEENDRKHCNANLTRPDTWVLPSSVLSANRSSLSRKRAFSEADSVTTKIMSHKRPYIL